MTKYLPNQLYQVPLAEIHPYPGQPRKYMDPKGIEGLTTSVRQVGVIQPIVCWQDPATSLVYDIDGERRCTAARLAGLTTIPAIFIEGTNGTEIALVENIAREDLNPVDEAEAMKVLVDDFAYDQERLANLFGKSLATISESLSLNKLPKEIRDECRKDPTFPKRDLIEIARKKQERSMMTRYRELRDKQAKLAAKAEAAAAAPAKRKRTKAEAIAHLIDVTTEKVGDLEFPDFSAEERAKLIEVMTSMKDTLEEAITRAVKNRKKPV